MNNFGLVATDMRDRPVAAVFDNCKNLHFSSNPARNALVARASYAETCCDQYMTLGRNVRLHYHYCSYSKAHQID